MSSIDKRALREAAEKAGSDKWQAKKINGDFYVIRNGSYEKQYGITSYQPIAEIEHKPVRDFVAAANPATVLALLDELEATYSRIGELEVIATDYGMKFQRAQDALKHQSLLHKSQLEAAEKTSAARLGAIDTTHKMFRRERDRADTAEKRIAELEAREVKLPERYEVEMCPTPSPDGDWYSREDVLAALKTAGIHTRGED